MIDSAQNARSSMYINVSDADELCYWSERLGVSEDRLKEAVASVGILAFRVAQELRYKMNSSQPPNSALPIGSANRLVSLLGKERPLSVC